MRRTRAGPGSVALVGGGPGDPGLVTTRGRQMLGVADVVVVDRLAPRAARPARHRGRGRRRRQDAGTPSGDPGRDQSDPVEHARAAKPGGTPQGRRPVRPGPGGEEVAACREAGVPVEVVPATSAVSVPAAVSIPVTHRGLVRQFTVVSGHDGLDWPTLARLEGTPVLLMGVSLLRETGTPPRRARPRPVDARGRRRGRLRPPPAADGGHAGDHRRPRRRAQSARPP